MDLKMSRSTFTLLLVVVFLSAAAVVFYKRSMNSPSTVAGSAGDDLTRDSRDVIGSDPAMLDKGDRSNSLPMANHDTAIAPVFDRVSKALPSALKGSPADARVVYKGYENCWIYALNSNKPQSFASVEKTEAMQKMVSAQEKIASLCRGFEGMHIGPSKIREMRNVAASGGNVAAEIEILGETAAAGKFDLDKTKILTEQALMTKDADAMAAASQLMGNLSKAYVDDLAPLPAGDDFSEATWAVAACRLGYDCSSNSATVTTMCAYGGINCDHRDLEAFYKEEVLSSVEARKLNDAVDKLIKGVKS
ncbi:hypothetical protein LPY95_22120 [Xanthomonas citri pv. malvacearum]|uniref:hypothetical protein n=2 Tax=Xanthomonas citri TaxID=346 RepID=UPI0022B05B8E|nr:hypothetical protein [Xanthomonas citri]WAW91229.1 hypothetical protein LPY95_22120 [Xanthomonas citri pv. malvacearum]WAW95394.1 hypothetical protein LGM68_22570 [Xanthomonas citri pv. malvacearum]